MRLRRSERQQPYDRYGMAVEAVRRLVAAIVDDPKQFPVTDRREGDDVFIQIRKGPEARGGQIIGKHGRNIDAIRTLAKAMFTSLQLRVFIELVDFDTP